MTPTLNAPTASPDVPRVTARVQGSRLGTTWLLTIRCPHCGRTHTHGGGPIDKAPSGGHRLGHCPGNGRRGYIIDIAEGAEHARRQRTTASP